jgi:SSS family solute:Na+ symporter
MHVAVNPWLVLVGYAVLVFLVAPRARGHRGFLWARGSETGAAAPPSGGLLLVSVLVSWIFAKSITNAANLGERFGLVGGLAYAAWYLSIPAAGLLIYRIRKGGHEGLVPFLTARYGAGAAFAFSAAILVRIFNEIWSNTGVVASYFGPKGSPAYLAGAAAFTVSVLAYVLRGGLRASIFTDRLQGALMLALLVWVLVLVVPGHAPAALASTSHFTLAGGLDLLLVGVLQATSYPFHDPVLTDRAFVTPPRGMLGAYLGAGFLGAAAIVLYSLVGVHARLAGLAGAGDAPVRVASALGVTSLAVVSALMMNSAGAVLDSAFTAAARHVSVDLAGEGGRHPSGFRGLAAPLRRLAVRDGGLRLGRWAMVAFAVLGNVPLLFGVDLLAATTISGTMVLGLAPPFLLWRLHAPAPAAFHLSFWTGMMVGIAGAAKVWPALLAIGDGPYASLLGQNVYGLSACFAAYGAGVLLEAVRQRGAAAAASYFDAVPVRVEEP